jgi:CelD/BcsL family acetyltransferase involved in cellulose biosynthesis
MSKRSLVQGNLGTIISAVAVTSEARPRNHPSQSRRIHAGGACRLRITDMVVPVLHGLVERKRQSITHLCAELNAAA